MSTDDPKLTLEESQAAEAAMQKQISLYEKINKLKDYEREIASEINKLSDDKLEKYKAVLREGDAELLKQEDILRTYKNKLEEFEKLTAAERDQIDNYDDIVIKLKGTIAGLKDAADAAKDLANQLKISGEGADYMLARFFGINQSVKDLGKAMKEPKKLFGDMVKLMNEGLTATNLLGSAAAKVAEGFKWASRYASDTFGVMKTVKSGMSWIEESRTIARDINVMSMQELAEFEASSTRLSENTRYTRSEMAKTRQELHKASNSFREMNLQEKESAIDLAKTLERRLGVAISNTAGMIDTMRHTFGRTEPESRKLAASFALQAKTLNLDVNKATADYIAQGNNLAKFGLPDQEAQFYKLAQVQQKTSISMNSIVSSMEKFTTFEGALTAASKLNAVFGSTIDGLELMDVTIEDGPLAGFAALKTQMEAAGMTISDMNHSQLKVLQENLGITAQELRQLGNISASELQKIADGSDSLTTVSEGLAQMKEGQKDLETPAERLAKAQENLAIAFQKVADIITEVQVAFADFMGSLGVFGPMLASGGAIMIGMGLLKLTGMAIAKILGVGIPAAAVTGGAALTKSGASAMIAAGQYDKLALSAMNASRAQAMGTGGALVGGAKAAVGVGAGAIAAGAAVVAGAGYLGYTYADEISEFTGWGADRNTGVRNATREQASSLPQQFAGGTNYNDQRRIATLGDSANAETHTTRAQRAMGVGDQVKTIPTGSDKTNLNLTIQIMAGGKVLNSVEVQTAIDATKTIKKKIDSLSIMQ